MRPYIQLAGLAVAIAVAHAATTAATAPLPLSPFTLGALTTYAAANTTNGDVAAGDLDGDGDADVVVANGSASTLEVRLNDGTGALGAAASYPVTSGPRDTVIADVNGDGHADVITALRSGPAAFRQVTPGVAVFLGNGDGTLQPQLFSQLGATITSLPASVSAVAVADMNGDGLIDVVYAREDALTVGLGDGAGHFSAVTRVAVHVSEVSLRDVDRDGQIDVVVNSYEAISLLRGVGTGDLYPATTLYATDGSLLWSSDVGDVNGDGLLDVVLTTQRTGDALEKLVTLAGNGDGTFEAPVERSLSGAWSECTRLADMDGDGVLDAVFTENGVDGVYQVNVALGNGDGTFRAPYLYGLPTWTGYFRLTDMDANALPDVVIAMPQIGFAVLGDGADHVAPTLTLPDDITAEAIDASGTPVDFAATATDGGAAVPVTCAPPSGSTFPIGTTSVTCSATDASGNSAEGSFHVMVRDTTAPVMTLPGDITASATSPNGATVTYTVGATDAVDNAVAIACSPDSGMTFPLGDTTVTCAAVDAAGNRAEGSFHVVVRDLAAPVLTLPADITAPATSASGAAVSYTAAAADNVDGAVTVSCTPASGSLFAIGTTTVTCSALDGAGNRAEGSFHVIVTDMPAPLPNADDLFAQLIAKSTGVGPGKSLVSKAREARDEYREGEICESCSTLDAYMNELRAQTGKKVTLAQAAELTDLVNRIRQLLTCASHRDGDGGHHDRHDDRDGERDRDRDGRDNHGRRGH